MSDADAVAAALTGLRIRERELELEAVAVKARVEEIRDMIERLEPRRRPGRPRSNPALSPTPMQFGEARANPYPSMILQQSAHAAANPPVVQMPDRVAGGMAGAEAGLPSLDDVRGILRTPDSGEAA